jgi:hypothetical protein
MVQSGSCLITIGWIACLALAVPSLQVRAEDSLDYGLLQLRNIDTPDSAMSVAVDDGFAFIADRSRLQVADISDLESPQLVGGVIIPDGASKVVVQGTRAFIEGDQVLTAVDISNPSLPVIVGTISGLRSVTLAGELACALGDSELVVVDLSNPVVPAIVGRVLIGGKDLELPIASQVAVAGTIAYITGRARHSGTWKEVGFFQIVNFSDPTNPITVSTSWSPYTIYSALAATGGYLYIASCGFLTIMDTSDPASPAPLASIFLNAPVTNVSANGSFASVTTEGSPGSPGRDVLVLDVSEPSEPEIKLLLPTPGPANGVDMGGLHVFVADGSFGLQMANIWDAMSTLVGALDTPSFAWEKVAWRGSCLRDR